MHLFVDISSHGFGHLSITAPVLQALAGLCPELRLTVRSGLSRDKLAERIPLPFDYLAGASDFGFVMHDPMRIDFAASAAAYRAAHAQWPERVEAEGHLLSRLGVDRVLSNVSYLPLAGAAQVGIVADALCCLNWGELFVHYFGQESWAPPIAAQIQAAYASARRFYQLEPGMAMAELPNRVPVAPIATLGQRHDLGLGDDRTVLVAFGGIAHDLPVNHWPRLPGLRWLVQASHHCTHPDALAFEDFGLSFPDLLASITAIVTKPGYGTFAEAGCNGTPVLYQRRADWVEQDSLIPWLHQHGRALEISPGQFERGDLAGALDQLLALPTPPRPRPDGAAQVAAALLAD